MPTHAVDLGGQSSGEEESLARNGGAVRERLENLEQLAAETLVKQAVGLVEHEGACR